jgi:hypothetical protein
VFDIGGGGGVGGGFVGGGGTHGSSVGGGGGGGGGSGPTGRSQGSIVNPGSKDPLPEHSAASAGGQGLHSPILSKKLHLVGNLCLSKSISRASKVPKLPS